MDTPNTAIYNALLTVTGVKKVAKPSSNVFTELPTLTYSVQNNVAQRNLNNEIVSQNQVCTIDIWSATSTGATDILVLVEAKMRELFFNLDFSGEIPNPNNDVYHISCRFSATNV